MVRLMASEQFLKFYGFHKARRGIYYAYYEEPMAGRRWAWLQRLCFKILRWLGARAEEKGIERVEIDYDGILDLIVEQPGRLRDVLEGQLRYVILGPRQARDILRDADPYYYKTFTLHDQQTRLCYRGVQHRGVLFGMTVIVIPWFDGVLLLPELGD